MYFNVRNNTIVLVGQEIPGGVWSAKIPDINWRLNNRRELTLENNLKVKISLDSKRYFRFEITDYYCGTTAVFHLETDFNDFTKEIKRKGLFTYSSSDSFFYKDFFESEKTSKQFFSAFQEVKNKILEARTRLEIKKDLKL